MGAMRIHHVGGTFRWAAAASALAAAMGCGGGGAGTGGSGGEAASSSSASSAGTGGGAAGIACDGQPTDHVSLGGTWAAYGKLAVSLQGAPGGAITICPTDQIGDASLLVMLTIDQDAADPQKLDKVQATLCSVELPVVTALVGACDPASEALVSTQIVTPPSFTAALPTITAPPATGTLSGTTVGSSVSLGPLVITVGATKSGAAMPGWDTTTTACSAAGIGQSACDPSCVDDCAALTNPDNDGYPGITVSVCGYTPDDTKSGIPCNAGDPSIPGATLQGKAFIDIEVDPTFTGAVKSSCEMTGAVATKVLYNLVGADIRLAGGSISVTSAINSLPAFQVDPVASKFRMVRIDGQYGAPDWGVDPAQPSAACATINARVSEL